MVLTTEETVLGPPAAVRGDTSDVRDTLSRGLGKRALTRRHRKCRGGRGLAGVRPARQVHGRSPDGPARGFSHFPSKRVDRSIQGHTDPIWADLEASPLSKESHEEAGCGPLPWAPLTAAAAAPGSPPCCTGATCLLFSLRSSSSLDAPPTPPALPPTAYRNGDSRVTGRFPHLPPRIVRLEG